MSRRLLSPIGQNLQKPQNKNKNRVTHFTAYNWNVDGKIMYCDGKGTARGFLVVEVTVVPTLLKV